MKDPKQLLVDVIQLSQKKCKQTISCELAYATKDNFLGRLVQGYHPDAKEFCVMTQQAGHALCEVQNQLSSLNLGLMIFDSYRPLRAVKDFGKWMQLPPQDDYELQRKEIHYPHLEKNQLAVLGYVNDHVSNHCFADTVDLGLIDLTTRELLDMGTCFDYFDETSHPSASADQIGKEGFKNRNILTTAMIKAGFLPYDKEYWHFTFAKRDVVEPLDVEMDRDLFGVGIA